MKNNFPSAELISQDGKYSIKIESYAYEFPEVKTGHDADWHRNHFKISAGVFRAEFSESCFEGKFLASVLHDLLDFSALKREQVEFEPTEPYIHLEFSFNSRKNVVVKGFVQHDAGHGPLHIRNRSLTYRPFHRGDQKYPLCISTPVIAYATLCSMR
jgi:hypothetical protein